jgi:biotin carboxylase
MKKVLIIGAGFLQDFVIIKARQMGYFTLAVDADPNAIGFQHADKSAVINIVDEKACLKFAQEEVIDGVLTAATDYGVLTASYIAQEMHLSGINYESAKLIKNKYLVRKRLFENHVDDTEQSFEINADTNIEEIAKQLSYPVMVKPCDGSGSRGASRVDKAEELAKACVYAMDGSITHRAEIESFITGEEYGAESLVVNGEIHVLSIMKKWMTRPPYYAELGHAIPCGLPKNLEQKARQCVENALRALKVNHGSVNMDMLITKEGSVHIIDIGARMGGNMIGPCIIPYGTGIDYIGNMLRAAVGDPLDWTVHEPSAVATKLLAFQGGIVKNIPDIKAIEKEYDVEIYHHLKFGDTVNEYHTNLDGCGYIVARRDNTELAEMAAAAVLEKIGSEIF